MTPTQPQAALLSESEIVACIAKAGCIGTVKMSYESGPYDIDRPSLNASRLYDAIEAAIIAKLQATQEPGRVFPPRIMELLEQVADRNPGTTKGPWEDAQGLPMQDDAAAAISWIKARSVATQEPVRAGELPTPFGYVSDGFPDGLHFQHKPWPEMHMLLNSVAQVYSAAQMRAALSAREPLTSEQVKALKGEYGYSLAPVQAQADFINGIRCGEKAHGIGLEVKP